MAVDRPRLRGRMTAARPKKGRTTPAKSSAKRIRKVIEGLYDDADPSASVTDILADLRHYCDSKGLSFGDCDGLAYGHYMKEVL